jgi:glycosyltransferase involved in cell wall biosynthesis
MFTQHTSLIIPTRNRAQYLENLLTQLKALKLKFKEIIVVDSSDKINKNNIKNICKKFSVSLYSSYPSISNQRNLGIKKTKNDAKYIMFADDDVVFFRNAFKFMNTKINKNKNNTLISGFGFNLIDKLPSNSSFLENLKSSKISQYFNLYSNKPGMIMKSGWQTKIVNIKKDIFVDWLYMCASVYKYESIKKLRFNLSLGSYSYLEDLDFCLNFKKKNKLIIFYNAKFLHPNFIERNNFKFGILEIENRFNIVKKYNLNTSSFFLGAIIKVLISFLEIFNGKFNSVNRCLGNICGIFKCLINF